MRVKGLNGQGGNKDMQLSAQAVIFPASVTVVKVADTERPTCSFEGKVAGNGGDTHTNEVTGTATDNEGNTAMSCPASGSPRRPGSAPSIPAIP